MMDGGVTPHPPTLRAGPSLSLREKDIRAASPTSPLPEGEGEPRAQRGRVRGYAPSALAAFCPPGARR